jgi:hypothetical protein
MLADQDRALEPERQQPLLCLLQSLDSLGAGELRRQIDVIEDVHL